MSSPRVLPSLLAALLPLALAGCGPAPESGDAAPPAPLVATSTVQEESWRETVELTAELAPWAAVTVAAEVPGRVVELTVDHGDRIGKGAVIARLDSGSVRAERAQAAARLESIRASLEQARRDLERGRSLAGENGILSADELDRLSLAVRTGEASGREAEAALEVIDERLANMEIRAPFPGTVSERHVEVGSWLGAGEPVVRLVDVRRLKARGSVTQADRPRLGVEAGVEVRTDALPGVVFPGRLRFLGEEAAAATGTFLVEAEVEPESADGGARLLPGMRGSMTLELARHRDLLVPRTALVDGALFVVEDGVAHRRPVESEAIGPGKARVTRGLEAGEVVVVQGQHRLADGLEVTVRDAEPGAVP